MLLALVEPSLHDLVLACVVIGILGIAFKFAQPHMAEWAQKLIIALAVIFAVIYLLTFFGIL